jgi:signal transduction histidine kinase
VSNSRRHGHAEKIVVGWESTDWEYHLWVEDDGLGFSPGDQELENENASHFGLKNMARRVERLGGTIDIVSAPGDGTTIQIRWPRTL